MKIRATTRDDILPLQRVLDRTGLFPAEMLAEMISGALEGGAGPRYLVDG